MIQQAGNFPAVKQSMISACLNRMNRPVYYNRNDTFYKERWVNEDGLEQKLVVTYSLLNTGIIKDRSETGS